MKNPILYTYDLNTKSQQKVICVTHTDDNSVDVIQLHVVQGGTPVDFSGNTITARMVMSRTRELLSDDVTCSIDATTKDVMIPIDNKVIPMRKGLMFIEVNVRGTLPETLTLQFPLLVRVNGSILDDAEITPESQGTIPELLIAAAEELKRVQGFITSDDVYEILDSTLQGVQNVAPSLYVKRKGDNYALVYEDSEDVLHELFDFSNLPSGTSDYTGLENKPQINGNTLSGNKSSDDLGLQKKLTAGQNITIESDGTISASGGVTSYKDLTDKPYLRISNSTGTMPPWEIKEELSFNAYDFYGQRLEDGKTIEISLDGNVCKFRPIPFRYDFNWISSVPHNGCLELDHRLVSNFPSALTKLDTSKPYFVSQFFNPSEFGDPERYLLRKVSGYSTNGGFVEYAQICYINYWYYQENQIISQTDWVELSGGSQIVSGVVNQNGTITFADSDGNTFTTTGSSVIGADGFSPVATVTQTASGATVSITDKNGTTTANISNGADGQDYILTNQDKTDIANIVLQLLPTTQGVLYGNTSN